MTPPSGNRPPKILARACLFCRARKIRCDTTRPRCSACVNQDRECIYRLEAPRKRPTLNEIHNLKCENLALQSFILNLKNTSSETRDTILDSLECRDGKLEIPQLPESPGAENKGEDDGGLLYSKTHQDNFDNLGISSDEDHDIASFVSIDEAGNQSSFGPSSALHYPSYKHVNPLVAHPQTMGHIRNSLVANAALQRQCEHGVSLFPDIDGVPTELAMHLLDLHWTRQHHTFLLTYRPAIMRDLLQHGPNCSKFLLNAIFACASKFSQRIEVRDDPSDRKTAGRRFFQRCDKLLADDSLLIYPTIPTIVGLLLLGSTYNARGETSKGWLYTGYALRMVYELGLHIDPKETTDVAEEVEIRRRVFWGAFICDKLQSLYLGRPVTINIRDCHVSRDFFDAFEENELYFPYMDPKYPSTQGATSRRPAPIYSVSTFQQLCLLSKIMTSIINRFYVVGATFSNARAGLQSIDDALRAWKRNLPKELDFQLLQLRDDVTQYPSPNLMNLHCLWHSLIILLHRPFISDGQLRSTGRSAHSWEQCTTAAECIANIVGAYESAYGLESAPYILSYAIYVACTIHVRNAAAEGHNSQKYSFLTASLRWLDKLSGANPGVAKPASIIRRLMATNNLNPEQEEAMSINQNLPSFDIDAILSLFPPQNSGNDGDAPGFDNRQSLDTNVPSDPLFGLMDGPFLP